MLIKTRQSMENYNINTFTANQLIGNTPLISLKGNYQIFAKDESYNAFGSVKARVADAMITQAEKDDRIVPNTNQTILEASGGSTGMALLGLSKIKGYNFSCILPDNYSRLRMNLMEMLGAEIITSDHTKGNDSHFKLARELSDKNPEGYFYIDQLSNKANPEVHYRTTGPEIFRDLPEADYLVCGVGSGGSITGIGRYLKEKNPGITIVAVQPEGCDVLNGKAIPHSIQGLAVGLVPPIFCTSIVDEVISVDYKKALEESIKVFKSDGIFPGISGGANISATKRLAKMVNSRTAKFVTLIPDSGRNYIEENFFKHL